MTLYLHQKKLIIMKILLGNLLGFLILALFSTVIACTPTDQVTEPDPLPDLKFTTKTAKMTIKVDDLAHYIGERGRRGNKLPRGLQRIDELFTLLNMHDFANRRADNMSTGMKQKTAIARAVVHSPKVVILDEPTTGLDIMTVQTVLDFIKGLKQAGTPVIFSTHHLDEVASLCDRVVVIDKGISAFSGDISQFRALSANGDLRDAFLSVLNGATNQQGAA